jgi:hypothetical protein
VGFRFRWLVTLERNREPGDEWPAAIRWAAFGLAVIAIAAVLIWRLLT